MEVLRLMVAVTEAGTVVVGTETRPALLDPLLGGKCFWSLTGP